MPVLSLLSLPRSDMSSARSEAELKERREETPGSPGTRVLYVPDGGGRIWEKRPGLFDRALADFVYGIAVTVVR